MGKRICNVEGCEGVHEARGWCQKHYSRWKRHGHIETVKMGRPRQEEVMYEAIHARIYWKRGKASDQKCGKCGKQAEDWALRWDIADELIVVNNRRGQELLVSVDENDYEALCTSCHMTFDKTRKSDGDTA